MARRQTNQRQTAIALYTSWQLDAKSLRIDDKSAIIVASECCKAYRTIGLSSCHKNNRNRRQLKETNKKLKKINENVFIDVIFRNEEKIARIDRVGLRPGFILAILPPPAVRVVCESL